MTSVTTQFESASSSSLGGHLERMM